MRRSIKSTLCSSGIFQKIDEENKLWFYKHEEAMHYIKRNAEKIRGKELLKKEKSFMNVDENSNYRYQQQNEGVENNQDNQNEKNLDSCNLFLKKK